MTTDLIRMVEQDKLSSEVLRRTQENLDSGRFALSGKLLDALCAVEAYGYAIGVCRRTLATRTPDVTRDESRAMWRRVAWYYAQFMGASVRARGMSAGLEDEKQLINVALYAFDSQWPTTETKETDH